LSGRREFAHTYSDDLYLRVLFRDPKLRFVFSRGFPSHNARVMNHIRSEDLMLCMIPCFVERFRLNREFQTLPRFGLRSSQVVLLCNTSQDTQIAREVGFQAEFINHNCWLDENLFQPDQSVVKDLDAILISSPLPVKRPHLAAGLERLAVVTYASYSKELRRTLSPAEYHECLSPEEVRRLVNRSKVGLCLSATEGACYACSEYLLCGLPVLSTPSEGGRDVWFTATNHRICRADPQAVAEGLKGLLESQFDAQQIRSEHINLSETFREKFRTLLARKAGERGLDRDWERIYQGFFEHKMVGPRRIEVVVGELRG